MQKSADVLGMWVELKEENGEMEKRVCHICGKAFSSGKALGGHMRSHVTKIKLNQNQDISFKNIQASSSLVKCVICGRKFPSMKSLFGHMRSHPERQWRGINPPPPSSSSSSSSPSSSVSDGGKDRAHVDLTESLIRGWSVTAKRGRKATVAARSDEEVNAVNFLMMLAKGRYGSVVDGDKVKGLMMKKRKKKVKLCDLNSMEENLNDNNNNNNIPIFGKLLDFDLNEMPPSPPSW